MPKIEVKINKKNDIRLFWLYFFNEKYINNWGFVRKSVISIFKELGEKFSKSDNQEDQKEILKLFVEDLYNKHKLDLVLLKEYIEKKFTEKSNQIFLGLEQTMDYQFDENVFCLNLSFLTVSTYQKDSANISILNDIGRKEFTTNYIDKFIHEISHTIFEEKINKIYNTYGKLDTVSHNYLKEIFAPIILRDGIFDGIRENINSKYANSQQQLMNISDNGIISNMVNYFEQIYITGKNKGASFDNIIDQSYRIFYNIQNQINQKNNLFFHLHNGESMQSKEFEEKLLSNGYGEAIIV